MPARRIRFVWILCALLAPPVDLQAQTPVGTAFTYQGRLTDGGSPANGDYDFTFHLYDALTGGREVAPPMTLEGVPVVNGLFTVQLDFRDSFRGAAAWLEIEVAPYRSGSYTLLSPRQELTPTPHALYAEAAGAVSGGITGSGSTNRVPKFTATRTIGNSTIFDNGTNVGVGSTSPEERLSVNGIVQSIAGGFKFPDGTIQTTASSGGTSLWQENGSNIYYNSGKVGIGTDSPAWPLAVEKHLNNNINPMALFKTTGTASTGSVRFENGDGNHFNLGITKDNEFALGYNANVPLVGDFLRITSVGTFGIGTTSPGEKLSVNGVVESMTGGFKFPDGTVQTTAGGGGSPWQPTGISDIYYDSGRVGIGTTGPGWPFHVVANNEYYAAVVNNANAGADSIAIGLVGQASGTGGIIHYGVQGSASNASDNTGVSGGASGGTNNTGVSGSATGGTKSVGVYGTASAGTKNYAGYFDGTLYASGDTGIGLNSPDAKLHVVQTSAADALRVEDESGDETPFVIAEDGHVGIGLEDPEYPFQLETYRHHLAMGVEHVGGFPFETYDYRALVAEYQTKSGAYLAMYLQDDPFLSYHYGVFGRALSPGGTNFGIYGEAGNGTVNYAGYFDGDVEVTGNLSKSSGSFKIDHPLDPAHKYLQHSFVESPDMMNVYNGNVVTDDNGNAWVDLPEYFGALNKDFRYQLTVVGQFAQAIVGQKIRGNRFLIRTDKPNVEVSWQVTGIRKDPYAEANRIEVEPEKREEEKGTYLYPEGYGFGREQSITALSSPSAPPTH